MDNLISPMWWNILKQEETYEALLNSLFIASGVTVMSTIIGTFLLG